MAALVTGVPKVENDDVTKADGLDGAAAVVVEEDTAAQNAETNEDLPNKLVDPNPSGLGSFLGAANESIGVDVGTGAKDGLGS